MTYTQCRLNKSIRNGAATKVCWIPTPLAVVGDRLKLREDCFDEWDDGWIVMETFGQIDEVPYPLAAIRTHRKNTGDSLKRSY